MLEFWVIGSVLVIYFLIMIPVQYSSIAATKKELKESGLTHNEAYEEMSFEQQQLQLNLQGNLFNLPARKKKPIKQPPSQSSWWLFFRPYILSAVQTFL